jgi:hypothetical protein
MGFSDSGLLDNNLLDRGPWKQRNDLLGNNLGATFWLNMAATAAAFGAPQSLQQRQRPWRRGATNAFVAATGL